MSVNVGSRAVTDNLILCIDAENQKSYGGVNYVRYSSYNATDWGSYYPGNTTITTDIDAPDGTNTALRVTCANTGQNLIRVLFPNFTPVANLGYTSTFYARLITPSHGPGGLATDVQDGSPNANYGPQLVANTWIRVKTTGMPSITSKNFIDLLSDSTTNAIIDFWGVQLETGNSETTLTETNGIARTTRANLIFDMSAANTTLCSFVGGCQYTLNPKKFDTGSTAITDRSYIATTPTFSFADTTEYSMEFWIRLRSSAPGTFHSLTGNLGTGQWITVRPEDISGNTWDIRYRDDPGNYHISSLITSSNIQNWTQVMITVNSGRGVNFFVNGNFISTQTAVSTLFNVKAIMGGYESGSNFYPLQGSMALCRMYSRCLTNAEVRQNFETTRRRFGL